MGASLRSAQRPSLALRVVMGASLRSAQRPSLALRVVMAGRLFLRCEVSFRQACNFSQERVGLGRTRGEGWRDDWLPREVQQVEAAGTAAVSGDAVASVSR
jgi:hypothetical protein